MYVPPHFKSADRATAEAIIADNPFALLVSTAGDEPFATHLPLDLDAARGGEGVLVGHLARANPHWRSLDGATAMAVFAGPHAYVSPRWYAGGPAVPTWNYVAVHVYGRARIVEDAARLDAILAALVRRYEGEGPWRLAELPETFLGGMRRGIVGIEIDVTRIETKLKLSQNRSAEDRRRVVEALEGSGRPDDAALAAAMRRHALQKSE